MGRDQTPEVDVSGDDRSMALRALPSVDQLLQDDETLSASSLSTVVRLDVIRRTLAQFRDEILAGIRPSLDEIKVTVIETLTALERPRLTPVINGTGVIVHTNLGRAPVSVEAAAAMAAAAASYVPLELDVGSGERGGRMSEIESLMGLLTGAEATLVVNNNAAAVLLVLSSLGAGREVVVSRGEAVEIGGGFRIPDVLRQSGATLVEVGTTNRTYPRDYRDAVTERTALFLKVHPSNFTVTGFTRSASVAELSRLDLPRPVPVIEDLGSGALLETGRFGLASEPTIAQSLRAGAAIVTASGDKLLGGPQAGIIAGRRDLVARIANHPLARAVRADKTCLAGIAATLRHYARGDAEAAIPVWRMIGAPVAGLELRANEIARHLAADGISVSVMRTESTVGGGSLPGQTLPSWAIAVQPRNGREAARTAAALRTGNQPVFARIDDGRVLIDLRTVLPEDDDKLHGSLTVAFARPPD